MSRRKYSEEYKQEAVELTRLPGFTIQGVGDWFGVPAGLTCYGAHSPLVRNQRMGDCQNFGVVQNNPLRQFSDLFLSHLQAFQS